MRLTKALYLLIFLAVPLFGQVPFRTSIVPATTNTYDVGSTTAYWDSVFARYGKFSQNVTVAGTLGVTGNVTMSATATADSLVVQRSIVIGSGSTTGKLQLNTATGNLQTILPGSEPARTWTLPSVGSSSTFITTGNLTAITATGTVTSGSWHGDTVETAYGGTNLASFNASGLMYAPTTSTLNTTTKIGVDSAKFTKYNDITLAGAGIGYIVARVGLSGQTSPVTTTSITGTSASADYRIEVYLFCDGVPVGTDQANVTITWRGSNGSTDVTATSSTITLSSYANYAVIDRTVYHGGGGTTNLKYAVAMPVNTDDDAWGLRIYVTRLN
jgi:hypothetical protein